MADLSNPTAGVPYPTFQPPQQNALSSQNPLQLALGITQLQAARSELLAKQAIGKAYQDSIGPDGYPDLQDAQRRILSDPNAAYAAPQAISDIAKIQGQFASNAGAWLQVNGAQSQHVKDFFGSLPKDADANDINNGVVTLKRLMPNVPSSTILGIRDLILNDPKGIAHGITTTQNLAMGPTAIAGRVAGPPEAGTGAPTTIPLSTANYAGTVQTGLPPGASESVGAMQADQLRTASYPQEVSNMSKALSLLRELGPGGTGEGSEGRQRFESYVTTLFPGVAGDALRNKVSVYDQLHKYLINNAQNAAQNFGPHTNEGLNTAVAGRPNPKISDLANDQLLQMNIAYRRMEQAQIAEASKNRLDYIGEKSRIAPQLDANAFRIDMMTAQERQQLSKSLKGQARVQFNRSADMAIRNGLINPPSQ